MAERGVIRKVVQAVWGALTNSYIPGFMPGKPEIYKGGLKRFCVPGMNCYSCPGALGACPIGALQSVFDGRNRRFAFYVAGYLAFIGLLVGRFICGWLCLFGLIQELLYCIPTPKIRIPEKPDRYLRYLKYVILLVPVFLLPFLIRDSLGMGDPYFCKYICPVGTLAGIPLILLNDGLSAALGLLFEWKLMLLILCILASVFIYRPFCRYICPLGAFYSLFQKVSLLRIRLDREACNGCGLCAKKCRMKVDPSRDPNSPECIRCGECIDSCPQKALSFNCTGRVKKKQGQEKQVL